MNFRIVIKQLGLLLCVLSVCMVLSNLAALVLRGSEEKARSVWELLAAAGVGEYTRRLAGGLHRFIIQAENATSARSTIFEN